MAGIRQTIQQIGEHPVIGYQTMDAGARSMFVTRYPYRVFYRVRGDAEHLISVIRRADPLDSRSALTVSARGVEVVPRAPRRSTVSIST